MAFPEFDERQVFSEGMRLMASCPVCQTRYQPQNAKLVAEKEDAYLVHVPCPKCDSAVVALIFANMFGVNSVGILTDLADNEVMTAGREALTADEVLAVYQASKDGTLAKAFST